MKYILSIIFLFSVTAAYAQKEVNLTTSAGWSVNYNKRTSDKPLPEGMIQHSRFFGFSTAFGLEYKLNPHWAIHAQVKTAGIKFGLMGNTSVEFDTISNKYTISRRGTGGSSTRNSPAHYQLGVSYYSDPIKASKFTWLVGGGVAYLVTRYKFPEDYEGASSTIGLNGAYNNEINNLYGKSFDVNMAEEFSRNGILLNFHTGLDFNFVPKHHLLLTLQHNEGLRRIRQFRSDYFNYVDLTPTAKTTEAFDVVIHSKGSYSALQLGYKYTLFQSK